jgi:hypothetical protein
MSYITILKEGIRVVNRNWQLVLIQMATMLFSFASFFFIVGIPIGIAFVIFGMDFTEILRLRNIESLFIGSAELLNKYFAMALVLFLSIIIYVIAVSVTWIFAIAGVAGILKDSIVDSNQRFYFRVFFSEGKHNFFPVMGYVILVSLIFIGIAFLLGIGGGAASKIIETARTQEETLAVFMSIFFVLLLLSIGLVLIVFTLSMSFYGIAYVVFNKQGAMRSLVDTVKFLLRSPSSIAFYVFVMGLYILASLLVLIISSPFTLIPIIGTVLTFPLQILNYFVQSYMSLIMIASMFVFFYRHEIAPAGPNGVIDIYAQEATEPSQSPEQMAEQSSGQQKTPPQNPSQ